VQIRDQPAVAVPHVAGEGQEEPKVLGGQAQRREIVCDERPRGRGSRCSRGGDYVDDDVAQAVKPELILHPTPAESGAGNQVTYDFPLDPAE
jgi:hypothetical protein